MVCLGVMVFLAVMELFPGHGIINVHGNSRGQGVFEVLVSLVVIVFLVVTVFLVVMVFSVVI